MKENTYKYDIKIDPLDFHIGLKDKMAEFESLIRMEMPGAKLAKEINKRLESRFCHCCFFGHVKGSIMGEPLCEECAMELYGITGIHGEYDKKKMEDLYHQLWYRKQKALPIFEAYLHSEIERFKLELKLEEADDGND